METIARAELLALDGAPDATFAVFRADGSLYFCTNAKEPSEDEDFWRYRGFTIKEVTP